MVDSLTMSSVYMLAGY